MTFSPLRWPELKSPTSSSFKNAHLSHSSAKIVGRWPDTSQNITAVVMLSVRTARWQNKDAAIARGRLAAFLRRRADAKTRRDLKEHKNMSVRTPERERVRCALRQHHVVLKSSCNCVEYFRTIDRLRPRFDIRQLHSIALQAVVLTVLRSLGLNQFV